MPSLAIAQLWPSEGTSYLGTAFAVSKFLAIGAFHCVGDRDTGKIFHTKVKARWLGGDLVSPAEYVAGDKRLDYALFELRPPLPDSYDLKPLGIAKHPPLNEGFRSNGFPTALNDDVKMPSIQGTVRSYDTKILGGVSAIQLFCDEAAARLKLPGFSGAPVIVGDDLALGLVRWNPPSNDDPDEGVSGMVFATSMISIFEQRPLFFRDVKVLGLVELLGAKFWL